jgi:hypothetical protein
MTAARTPNTLNMAHVEWLPLKRLTVDERIQRPLNQNWIKRTAPNFDPDALGALEISLRKDGRYVIVDGQHRKAMLETLGYLDQLAPCLVHRGLTFEQEAKLFVNKNTMRRPELLDFYLQRLNAKEELAVAIHEIVSEFGLTIGRGNNDKNIQAIKAVQVTYLGDRGKGSGRNPKALRDTLWTLIAAWGSASEVFTGDVLEGLGLMFLRDNTTIDRKLLAEKLAKQGSVSRIIGRAKMAKETHGGSVARNVAGVATELYNRGHRVNKLSSWWAE